jgi:serine/threonine protein kinase
VPDSAKKEPAPVAAGLSSSEKPTLDTPCSFGERVRRRFGEGANPGIFLEKKVSGTDPAAKLHDWIEKLASRTGAQRYMVLGEVARGGMGAVLHVWDEDLQRSLAMKVLLTNGKDAAAGSAVGPNQEKLHRFLAEAQVTGQMDHHGIPPVHEIGIDLNGHVYFTMALIRGQDVGEIIDLARQKKEGWSLARALEVIVKVCETVAYAHSRGVIHRDLKPSNILIGRFGQVYVMDWGVAKVLGSRDARDLRLRAAGAGQPPTEQPPTKQPPERREEPVTLQDTPLMTMDGSILGTPSYMPPEQAHGNIDDLGPHSDVYSVGAMLYTLLTGQMPYVKAGAQLTPRAVLLAVRNGPPRPVRDIDPTAPAELVAICEKAMARSSAERYADMNDMAEDLRAYLENRVVSVYWTGTVAECAKWLARNKPLAIGAAAFLALAIGAWIDIALIHSRTDELSKAGLEIVKAHDEALVTAEEARHKTYAAYIAAADASLRANDDAGARKHLEACGEDLRGWEWRYLWRRANGGPAPVRWRGPGGEVRSVSFSPDGQFLASASADGAIHVWNRAGGSAPRKLGEHEAAANAVAFSPDAGWIVSGSEDGTVRLWTADRKEAFAILGGHEGPITAVAFARGGARLVSASRDKTLKVWEAPSGRLLSTLQGHGDSVTAVVTSPGGGRIASAAADGTVRLWDDETGETVRVMPAQGGGVLALAMTASGNVLVAADSGGTVWIWNGHSGEALGALVENAEGITALTFSPGGERLVAGQADGKVRLWDRESGNVAFVLSDSDDRIGCVAFSPDGDAIAAASSDGAVLLWDAGPMRTAEPSNGN